MSGAAKYIYIYFRLSDDDKYCTKKSNRINNCLLFQITNTEEGVFSICGISEHGIKGRKKQKYWLSPRNVTQARPHPVHVDLQLRGAGPPRPSVEPAGFCDVLLYLWLDHRVSVLKFHGSVSFCCQRFYSIFCSIFYSGSLRQLRRSTNFWSRWTSWPWQNTVTWTKSQKTYRGWIANNLLISIISIWRLCFRGVTDLNSKYTELLPYLEQIDQIDASVERLYLSLSKNFAIYITSMPLFQVRTGSL